jgi:hypothetical protein
MEGDITALWYHDLYARLRTGPIAMAGLTLNGALFCLDVLARNHGMRVVFRQEHTQRLDGVEVANLVTAVARQALEVRPPIVAVLHLARPEGDPEHSCETGSGSWRNSARRRLPTPSWTHWPRTSREKTRPSPKSLIFHKPTSAPPAVANPRGSLCPTDVRFSARASDAFAVALRRAFGPSDSWAICRSAGHYLLHASPRLP